MKRTTKGNPTTAPKFQRVQTLVREILQTYAAAMRQVDTALEAKQTPGDRAALEDLKRDLVRL